MCTELQCFTFISGNDKTQEKKDAKMLQDVTEKGTERMNLNKKLLVNENDRSMKTEQAITGQDCEGKTDKEVMSNNNKLKDNIKMSQGKSGATFKTEKHSESKKSNENAELDHDYEEVNENLTSDFPEYAQVDKSKKTKNRKEYDQKLSRTEEESKTGEKSKVFSNELQDGSKIWNNEEDDGVLDWQNRKLFYDYASIDKIKKFDPRFKPDVDHHEYAKVDKTKKKVQRENKDRQQKQTVPLSTKVAKQRGKDLDKNKKEVKKIPVFPDYAQVNKPKTRKVAKKGDLDSSTSTNNDKKNSQEIQRYQKLQQSSRDMHVYQKLIL